MIVYLNGEFLPKDEARLSVDERGFIFGDGVYEVTRAIGGRLFQEEAHWRRLARGLRELRIEVGAWLTRERVREVSERLLRENHLTDGEATVYLQVTRGAAPRTHWFPPEGTPPTVYLCASPFVVPVDLRERGAKSITLPDIRWARCDLKTVNLIPAAMAKQRAHEVGAFDAVLLRDGAVTEGGATNVFGVVDGVLRTYPKSNYILPGITRDLLLEMAPGLGIPVEETPIFAEELPRLEELFFTGTTTDVQPIVELDGRRVGAGVVGPVARALQQALAERMGSTALVAG
jgi:D-alanine transaminase